MKKVICSGLIISTLLLSSMAQSQVLLIAWIASMFTGSGALKSERVWVHSTTDAISTANVFMRLKADEDGTLIAVSSKAAGYAEIQELFMDGDRLRLRTVPRVDFVAEKVVEFQPGAKHVVLVNLKQPLKVGDTVPLTLHFEDKDKKVSEIEVEAEVLDKAPTEEAAT